MRQLLYATYSKQGVQNFEAYLMILKSEKHLLLKHKGTSG